MVRAAGRQRKAQFSVPILRDPKPPKPIIRANRMTTRAEWEALPAQGEDIGERLELPIAHIRFLYTGTESCDLPEKCTAIVKELQRESQGKGNPDIMYNFLIGGDHILYEGRGWDYRCSKKDFWVDSEGESINIAYIGNFKGKLVPPVMRHVGEHLIKWGKYHRLFEEKLEITPHLLEPYDKEEMEEKLEDVPEFTHLSLEKMDQLWQLPAGAYKKEVEGESLEGDGKVGDESGEDLGTEDESVCAGDDEDISAGDDGDFGVFGGNVSAGDDEDVAVDDEDVAVDDEDNVAPVVDSD